MLDMVWDPVRSNDNDNIRFKHFVDSKEERELQGYDAGQGSFNLQGGYQHHFLLRAY